MRVSIRLLTLALLALSTSALAEPLGLLGDPEALQFEGNQAITDERLRDTLRRDWLVQVGAAPSADRAAYAALVQRRLATGYASWGFPHPGVAVTLPEDGEVVRVAISEGERYTAGRIEITGDEAVDRPALIRWLTQARAGAAFQVVVARDGKITIRDTRMAVPDGSSDDDSRPAAWIEGTPVRFHDTSYGAIRSAVRHGLLAQGLPNATFEVDVEQQADLTALLRVSVTTAGRPAFIETIKVDGLKRHERADLLAACGLEDGMRLDPESVGAIHRTLWASGRFCAQTVTATPTDRTTGGMALHIEVVEQTEIPLLTEPLSEAQAAALRLRDRLADHAREDGLLVSFTFDQAATRLAVDARGVTVRADPLPDADPVTGDTRLRRSYALWAGPGAVSILDYAGRQSRTAKVSGAQVLVHFGALGNPEHPGGHGTFSFFAGVRSTSQADLQPLAIRAYFDPVCFLALASEPEHTVAVEDGVLQISGEHHHLRADAGTGRLLSWRATDDENGWRAELTTMPDAAAVLAQRDKIEQDEVVSGIAMIVPVVRWALEAAFAPTEGHADAATAEQQRVAARAVGRLFGEHVFAPVLAMDHGPAAQEKLSIPVASEDVLQHGMATFFLMALPLTDELWERASWPWTLGRQTLLLRAGQTTTARGELGRLYASRQMGPLANYAAARLLAPMNRQMAGMFARQGLERMSAGHLESDLEPLVDGRGVQPQVARQFIAALQSLTEEEADAIDAVWLRGNNLSVAELRDALVNDAGQPLKQDAATLAKHWFPMIEAALRDRLDAIAAPAGAPAAPR